MVCVSVLPPQRRQLQPSRTFTCGTGLTSCRWAGGQDLLTSSMERSGRLANAATALIFVLPLTSWPCDRKCLETGGAPGRTAAPWISQINTPRSALKQMPLTSPMLISIFFFPPQKLTSCRPAWVVMFGMLYGRWIARRTLDRASTLPHAKPRILGGRGVECDAIRREHNLR